MIDLNNVPGVWHGKEHNEPWLWQSSGHRPAAPTPLWQEHYENLVAEAEAQRRANHLPHGKTWQRRLCSRIGHWLIASGRRLESAGRLTVPSAAQ